jgi:hypothetical protein
MLLKHEFGQVRDILLKLALPLSRMRHCAVATRPSVNEASGPKGCFRAIRSRACDLRRCDGCSSDCRFACEPSALQCRLEKRCFGAEPAQRESNGLRCQEKDEQRRSAGPKP